MKKAHFFPLIAAGLLLGSTGCATYENQRVAQQTREREDVLLLQERVRQLDGRLEGIEMELQQLYRDITAQNRALEQTRQEVNQNVDRQLQTLASQVQQLQQSRQADKQEIINSLTATIQQMIAASGQSSRRAASSGYGYEHTVQPGETLSQIAQAYGVTSKAIIDANQLANPNMLRVGQTLFVPE
jgi:LysM repeat protein